MPKIFICYRREDTLDFAGRLHDRLGAKYGAPNVVLDVDNVPIGVNFQNYLDSQIEQCDLLLALIGPHWLAAANPNGRRLDDPRDFVRIEIESALRRQMPVIPILVGGAAMPRAQDLPESLAPLSYINAAELASNRDFNAHFERLAKAIDELTRGKAVALAPASPVPVEDAGPKLMAALKRKLEQIPRFKQLLWKNIGGWWSVRLDHKVILRIKPSKNLIRVRVRKNADRPVPPGMTVAHNFWFADGPESRLRREADLVRVVKLLKSEWDWR